MAHERRVAACLVVFLVAIATHRCVHAASPSPAPPGLASRSPMSACRYDAISAPLRTAECWSALDDPATPTRPCCAALEGVLGPGGNPSTAGCACMGHAWTEAVWVAKQEGIHLEEILEACNSVHATEFVWYQGQGMGKCSDKGDVLAALQSVEDQKMRSFREWIVNLPDQPAVFVSFLFSIPFGAGAIFFLFIASQALVL